MSAKQIEEGSVLAAARAMESYMACISSQAPTVISSELRTLLVAECSRMLPLIHRDLVALNIGWVESAGICYAEPRRGTSAGSLWVLPDIMNAETSGFQAGAAPASRFCP